MQPPARAPENSAHLGRHIAVTRNEDVLMVPGRARLQCCIRQNAELSDCRQAQRSAAPGRPAVRHTLNEAAGPRPPCCSHQRGLTCVVDGRIAMSSIRSPRRLAPRCRHHRADSNRHRPPPKAPGPSGWNSPPTSMMGRRPIAADRIGKPARAPHSTWASKYRLHVGEKRIRTVKFRDCHSTKGRVGQ